MRLAVTIALLTCLSAAAAPRDWRNTDGSRSVRGDFISRDAGSVLIRRSSDLKQARLPLAQMHPDDVAWLEQTHPLAKAVSQPAALPPADPKALIQRIQGCLAFGEPSAKVTARLKASGLFECTMPESFLARTGLNGVFRTRQKITDHHSQLYFGWNDDGGLKDFTLHTDPMPLANAKDRILPCWQSYVAILTELYGKPLSAGSSLDLASIQPDAVIFTHLWESEQTGAILVGAGRTDEGYHIALRFSGESYKSQVRTVPDP